MCVSTTSLALLNKATYPLEHLLSPHILESAVQVLDLLRQIIDLALIRALNLAGLSDCKIQSELYARMDTTTEPCTALLHVLGYHT